MQVINTDLTSCQNSEKEFHPYTTKNIIFSDQTNFSTELDVLKVSKQN